MALSEYPLLNSTFTGEEIVYHGAINLGVAMVRYIAFSPAPC